MSLTIRIANKDDLAAITLLENELHDYSVDPSIQWKHFENTPDRAILVAELGGTIVGMVILNLVYKLSKVMCYLDEIVVLGSERGGGIGSALMKAAEDWSWEHGADIIDFSSRGKDPGALEFYNKLGYAQREAKLYRKKREGYSGSS